MKLLIKNGHVVDPVNKLNEVRDILIVGTHISKVAGDIEDKADKIIDASGKIVMPGIIDMHVHLREPGREDKETIETGTKAALRGGVTSVLAMPNTEPAMDSVENVRQLKDIIKKSACANVYIAGAITKARAGKELTDIAKLKKEGVIAITDDGASVDDEKILKEVLKLAKKEGILVICHCEDKAITRSGVINLGIMSTRLGLKGTPRESEYKRVQRDIQLAQKLDAPIHIAHVSCKESIEIIAQAKKIGLRVTAETAPHYFCFCDEDLFEYNTNLKVNPPLKAKEDVQAIKEALKNGIIDVIASDHAPHTENEKDVEFERAEFGAIGLETELAASISELIIGKILDWPALVERLSTNPAKVLGLKTKGALSVGLDADIIVVDPQKEWLVKKDGFQSKAKNSPFIGRTLRGIVEYTICNGEIAYINANNR
ncbi:MAG: dihydroorotase [Candidatus Omnitrophota bacterium]